MSTVVWQYPSGGPLSAASLSDAPADYAARMLSRLPTQFRGKPRIEAVLRALASEVQELHDVMRAVLLGTTIDNAVGAQLDVIGRVVLEPRNGEADDEVYRRRLRARVAIVKSRTLVEDLISVARLTIGDPAATVRVLTTGPAAVTITIEGVFLDVPTAEVLLANLKRAKAAGVLLTLQWVQADTGYWDSATWDGPETWGYSAQ